MDSLTTPQSGYSKPIPDMWRRFWLMIQRRMGPPNDLPQM